MVLYYCSKENNKHMIINTNKDFLVDNDGLLIAYKGKGRVVEIPNNVKKISKEAFTDCIHVDTIYIPKSVTFIPQNAFCCCKYINKISVSKENPIYDSRDNCNAIIESKTNKLIFGCWRTIIPNSVTTIAKLAFNGVNLEEIKIPNGIKRIEEEAFYNCDVADSIDVPESVTFIGDRAFSYCSDLKSIKVSKKNKVYDSRNDCNAIIETKTNKLILGCYNTIIPNSVTSIGDEAFAGCSSLESINIPNTVTSIGRWAFDSCYNLKSLDIPNSVKSIGAYAFRSCSKLKSITLPNDAKKGKDILKDCHEIYFNVRTSDNNIARIKFVKSKSKKY